MRDLRIREEGREEGEEGSGEQKVVATQLLPPAAICRLPPGHPSLLLPPSLLYSSLRLDTGTALPPTLNSLPSPMESSPSYFGLHPSSLTSYCGLTPSSLTCNHGFPPSSHFLP